MSYTYEYPRPAVTVDTVVFRKTGMLTEVLLIKRLHPPFEGMWAIPGGFINMDEKLEDAALRELQEETGIREINLERIGVFDDIYRDPRHRTIAVAFAGFLIDGSVNAIAGDDAAECQWFNLNAIPKLAFDHNKILDEALKLV